MGSSQGQLAPTEGIEDSDSAHNLLLTQVEGDLLSPPGRMAFSQPVEKRFQEARDDRRRRHFLSVGLAGFLSFDLFLIADRLIMRDIFPLVRNGALCVITPLALLILFLISQRKLPPEMVIFNLFMTFGASLAWSAMTHSGYSVLCFFVLPIFFIFSNIGYPLPFKLAAVYTAVCLVSSMATVFWAVHFEHVVQFMILVISNAMGGYTLVACYRLEAAERRNYLLNLRETLRSEVLLEKNQELRGLSETDGLTGISNRRVFDRTLQKLWGQCLQSRSPLALLMIDIDHFKRLNDTHGHHNGDVCLKMVAGRLLALMHANQCLARYGGEEFAVLLVGEGARKAATVAERLRAEIEAMPVLLTGGENREHRITVSVGCATANPCVGLSSEKLFLEADKALYEAKRGGRNCVREHSLEPAWTVSGENRQAELLTSFDSLSRN